MALVREVNMGLQDLLASLVPRDRMVSLVGKEKEVLLVREAKEALRGSLDPREGLGLL